MRTPPLPVQPSAHSLAAPHTLALPHPISAAVLLLLLLLLRLYPTTHYIRPLSALERSASSAPLSHPLHLYDAPNQIYLTKSTYERQRKLTPTSS